MARPNSVRRLERAGIDFELHEVGPQVKSGEAMAAALDVPEEQVLRTLVCELELPSRSGAGPTRRQRALVLVASDRALDLARLAKASEAVRARLASHDEAERWTGLKRGGISALAVPAGRFEVLVDERVALAPRVFVSAGAIGLELELAPAELVRVLDARFAALV
ncbi:MAG: YbaK/EbsC family protein [Planctomycetota bacterium]